MCLLCCDMFCHVCVYVCIFVFVSQFLCVCLLYGCICVSYVLCACCIKENYTSSQDEPAKFKCT